MGAAPLRESLAAGLLLELGYDGPLPFLDPMCGSGTIAVEAALLAGRRAPGLGRTFAFEGWPGHDAARTREVRERLAALSRDPPAPVLASDRNGGAVRLAGKNAEAAGMARFVRIERRDAADVAPPPGPGVCLVNPPYGIRLDREVEESWRSLGSLLGAPLRLDGGGPGRRPGRRAAASRASPPGPSRSRTAGSGAGSSSTGP